MKYLVTGGHGKLGTALCPLIDAKAPTHADMDILSKEQLLRYADAREIDAILHLAAVADRRGAERDRVHAYNINVRGTAQVAQVAAELGKKIIYISTDCVFNGIDGNYSEEDAPDPRDWYGFTKYAGELEVQHATDNYLIIRTSFRPSSWPFPTAFDDILTSADYVDVIAQHIAHALTRNIRGVLHIGTPTKSMYELAKQRNPEVQPEHAPNDPLFAKRRDMNISKWLSLQNT